MAEPVVCNICKGETYSMVVKEQMLGLLESFTYYICKVCGHAHLPNIPENIEKYYRSTEYYSFIKKSNGQFFWIKKIFLAILVKIGFLNNLFFSHSVRAFLKAKQIDKQTPILDYGCGTGYFINELHQLGYKNAMGFDPYLPSDTNYNNLIIANKINLLPIQNWEVITLNHVLEHLFNPVQSLLELSYLLDSGGYLIIRIPVIDSFAFEKYKENWVQFDAPRHLNLFTRKSIMIAIEKVKKFNVLTYYDDSFHFQFTGSELYLKNKSLSIVNNNRRKRLLTLDTYKYHFMAKKLNRMHQGDQIVIVLEKV